MLFWSCHRLVWLGSRQTGQPKVVKECSLTSLWFVFFLLIVILFVEAWFWPPASATLRLFVTPIRLGLVRVCQCWNTLFLTKHSLIGEQNDNRRHSTISLHEGSSVEMAYGRKIRAWWLLSKLITNPPYFDCASFQWKRTVKIKVWKTCRITRICGLRNTGLPIFWYRLSLLSINKK